MRSQHAVLAAQMLGPIQLGQWSQLGPSLISWILLGHQGTLLEALGRTDVPPSHPQPDILGAPDAEAWDVAVPLIAAKGHPIDQIAEGEHARLIERLALLGVDPQPLLDAIVPARSPAQLAIQPVDGR